jgi:DNA repair protein RecO (recombination protein O)
MPETADKAKRHRSYRTHAVVLRRRDYADADRVVTVFTPGMGKQSLIAKGARKTTSRKAGHLELFTHANLQVAEARTWDIITEATTVEPFRHLRVNLDAIGYASYVCELIDCFTEEDDENQALWELLLLALRELDTWAATTQSPSPATADAADPDSLEETPLTGGLDVNVLLRWYELHLLSLTGFQPQLFQCLDCDRDLEPVVNYLVLHEGGVICPDCRARRNEAEEIDPNVLKVLRYLQMRPWQEVAQLTVRPQIMRAVQSVLYRYLLTILEHQLRSTDFLRRLQRLDYT